MSQPKRGRGDRGTERLVLYRCRTPTNFLCPCGAVARKLAKHELDYRTERVPYSRKDRPEILELTKQNRVPVLVDGDEVIHDSKRIRQWLDWKAAKRSGAAEAGQAGEAGRK